MTVFSELSSAWKSARKPGGRRKKLTGLNLREAKWGLLFLSPWLIGLLLFWIIPMIASLAFSFTEYDLTHPENIRFVGLENYRRIFNDPQMADALTITIQFMLIAAPIGLVWPILMAVLLNSKKLWAKRFFRTLYFMPSIVPIVSAAYIWRGFLNTQTGWLNRALDVIGISGPDWLGSTVWIYPALILVGLWGVGDAMLRTLATLQTVPTELYEAARVDGANEFHSFFNITIPLISPMIFYNLMLTIIGFFQYFTLAWILGGPNSNPAGSTLFYNVYLYKQAFVYSSMGYGSTLAWILFFLAMTATVLLFGTQKYWVYYAGGD